MQWHPLFAHLLRPLVEGNYQVETNVPVGDLPREADIVLLRRIATPVTPFEGLWRHLTAWNVLEFKGPTESARVADIDSLVELGLGVDRRLNATQRKEAQPEVERDEVSLWYLANHLGSRFLRDVRALVGEFENLGPGVWRRQILGRWLVLVSNKDVPVERDSIPIHLLVREPVETTRELALTVIGQADLAQLYGNWFALLFPTIWKEFHMTQQTKTEPIFDWPAFFTNVGPQLDWKALLDYVGQAGYQRVIEQVGLEKVIEQVGPEKVLDTLLPQLTPDVERELLQRLQKRAERQGGNGNAPSGSS